MVSLFKIFLTQVLLVVSPDTPCKVKVFIFILVDIPRDCQQARENFYYDETDLVLIDTDGGGRKEKFYVICDMSLNNHVGIMTIPHTG